MITDKKGRAGVGSRHQPRAQHVTGIIFRLKLAVVTLTLWGAFPIGLVERINQIGGAHHD